ncbi:MAG: TRAP transporter substrate-binding protein [Alphaproteobacteria bacterium]|jgi:TRAP-type mannitol/chloroaromatic compound transport system substrate-binding protein|nr:TRAP transporter substrate-binding protein [Alphaproteobacteria bacterium]HJO87360.1 TRAP transporter substrate-binding protein [Rhodospirillales bacterium]|tara:strand:- start:263 stop:1375 length:1113 start_codon:yes stop_codon:yes gene_type:complete
MFRLKYLLPSLLALLLGVTAFTTVSNEAAAAEKIKLKVQAAFPSSTKLFKSFNIMNERVKAMSNGRLEMELFPGGAIVPSFQVLDATARHVLDGGFSAAAYYVGKNRAAALFGPAPGGPYGFDWIDYFGWIHDGGGLALYNEFFQKVLKRDVVVFPMTAVGNQVLGWFDRPVKGWHDLKDIKCRATGLTGEVLSKSGMKTVNMSGGEILPSAERGIINCGEWAGPGEDIAMGFHQVWKHYYMPSVHEPATILELLINGEVWRKLPPDLQEIVKSAIWETTLRYQILTHRQNAEALVKIRAAGVTVHRTPDSILQGILDAWEDIVASESAKNPFFKKVLASQKKYAALVIPTRRAVQVDYNWLANHYWPEK